MPPNIMISVSRNTHMPKVEASFCWAMSSNWWTRAGWCSVVVVWLWDNSDLLFAAVVIRFLRHYGSFVEIMSWRRRTGLPLQACCFPGIRPGNGPIPQRPNEVDGRQDKTDRQDRGPRAGEHVQNLELRRVHGIA